MTNRCKGEAVTEFQVTEVTCDWIKESTTLKFWGG